MYIDAYYDKDKNIVNVVERDENRNRVFKTYPAELTFYYEDKKGKYLSLSGEPLSKVTTTSPMQFAKELAFHDPAKIWEHDIKPVFRTLSTHYLGAKLPTLNVAFIDIETDFHAERGFSTIDDPFNPITAITIYLDWTKQCITLAIPPKGLDLDKAQEIVSKFDNCFMFTEEKEMLDVFLTVIEEADVLSGWNSEGYDIPYLVGRIIRKLSKDDTRRLSLWDIPAKKRIYERYGAQTFTYDIVGRVHFDYMKLYQKYTYHEMHSYSLDAIAEYELGEHKIAYDGTLDQLYNDDFEKFLEYNRQDVMLLDKLDKKLKFIDLANAIAHDNTVLLPTVMGAVAVTEQAIINEAHNRGFIVPSRRDWHKKKWPKKGEEQEFELDDEDESDLPFNEDQAAGAYVADPKKGMHKFIGAIDINSLYPSAIRALNMGPDTIVGQIRPIATNALIAERMADKPIPGTKRFKKGCSFAAAWEGLFGTLEYQALAAKDPDTILTIDWEKSGETTECTAAEAYELIFNSGQPWCVTANGTILTIEGKGIIPGLLERWYAERKTMQKKAKEATDIADIEYWDKQQLVRKINLNSLYGALLQSGCRFFDQRIGQSTTLSGRCIAKHMDSVVNQELTGKYEHDGDAIVYGDTDSCYFSAWPIIKDQVEAGDLPWDNDICIKMYDAIADKVNESFPHFMKQAFNCPLENGAIIKGGRELVASSGLFIKKKRYAVVVYDLEGKRLDHLSEEEANKKGVIPGVGKIKAMGLDLKRADTPPMVQDFLSSVLLDVLTQVDLDLVAQKIIDFKEKFSNMQPWEKGTPKRVNNLTKYTAIAESGSRQMIPGHVMGAINWNKLRNLNNDKHSPVITDGMKIIVCRLRESPSGIKVVSFPIDIREVPQWYKDLPFDVDKMETAIVAKKIDNLIGVLKLDINKTKNDLKFDSLFSFE